MRYLAAAHMGGPGSNGTVYRIVLHATVSPCRSGQAWSVAQYFANPASGGSAHWTGDPGEIIQSVPEDRYAWHAPPNQHSLGFEMCDSMVDGYQHELPEARWGDGPHKAMMALTATHLRGVADRHGIPLRWLTVAEVRAGGKGFCDHHDVSQAFGQSSHWDCGVGFHAWRDYFMSLVKGGTQPATTTAAEAIDMFVGQDQMTGAIYLVSGNTKLQFPSGGGDQYPGGSLYAAVLLDHLRQAYPDGPAPRLVALNPDVASRIPPVEYGRSVEPAARELQASVVEAADRYISAEPESYDGAHERLGSGAGALRGLDE